MNFTTLTLLCLATYVFSVEWVNINPDLDNMYIYRPDTCVESLIVERVNDTHALITHYNDMECTSKNESRVCAVKYINNLQYYIDMSYYEYHLYSTANCNDNDFSIPITGYHLLMKEHCNTEGKSKQSYRIGFYDHSEDRVFALYDDFGTNSSICRDERLADGVGGAQLVGQCYNTGYSRFKVFYNKRRFETNDVDPTALMVFFVVVILII